MSKNLKNHWKDVVDIEEENLDTFWTTWGISMKYSGKMCIVWSHFHSPIYFSSPSQLKVPPVIFWHQPHPPPLPSPQVLGQFSIPRNHDEKYKGQ